MTTTWTILAKFNSDWPIIFDKIHLHGGEVSKFIEKWGRLEKCAFVGGKKLSSENYQHKLYHNKQ